MKYVIPFTDDLSEYQEALGVIDGLYTVIEGLREHSARLE